MANERRTTDANETDCIIGTMTQQICFRHGKECAPGKRRRGCL